MIFKANLVELLQQIESLLLDEITTFEILAENQNRLAFVRDYLAFVDEQLLSQLNKHDSRNFKEDRVKQAIFILLAQGIKSYKSGILLCIYGYFSNAVITLRSLLEVVFNVKYILEHNNLAFSRANSYLTKPRKWTSSTVQERAYKSLDRYLYRIYKLVCNYVHANYLGAGQNFNGDLISTGPSSEKIFTVLDHLTAVHIYLTQFICDSYGVAKDEINSLVSASGLDDLIKSFNTESDVLEFFKGVFLEAGISNEDFQKVIEHHKSHDLKIPKHNQNAK